jgi:hypothetical protein
LTSTSIPTREELKDISPLGDESTFYGHISFEAFAVRMRIMIVKVLPDLADKAITTDDIVRFLLEVTDLPEYMRNPTTEAITNERAAYIGAVALTSIVIINQEPRATDQEYENVIREHFPFRLVYEVIALLRKHNEKIRIAECKKDEPPYVSTLSVGGVTQEDIMVAVAPLRNTYVFCPLDRIDGFYD